MKKFKICVFLNMLKNVLLISLKPNIPLLACFEFKTNRRIYPITSFKDRCISLFMSCDRKQQKCCILIFRQHAASIYGFVHNVMFRVCVTKNLCVRSLGYIVGASLPLWKYVCLFVGLHCGCVPQTRKKFYPYLHPGLSVENLLQNTRIFPLKRYFPLQKNRL